jgi:hypothetical protein
MEIAPPSPQSMPPHPDPLGTRHRRTTGDGVEDILDVRPDLAAAGFFEFPLRERVLRLAEFHHRSFVQVHRVERAPGRHGALAIVSDAADGVLLSDVLAAAAGRGVAVPAAWALDIIRQLVDSMSAMHAIARDVGHGALTPPRILIGSGGDVLIRDYVFGAALEQLGYPSDQYWTELGIPTNPEAPGVDQRLDLFQIGLLGLQLLGEKVSQPTLARPARQRAVSGLAGSGEAGPLVADARRWLARMLQLDAPFTSALDARKDLESLLARHRAVSALVSGPPAWLPAAAPVARLIGDTPPVAPAGDLPLSHSPFPKDPAASIDSHEAHAQTAATTLNGAGVDERFEMPQPPALIMARDVDVPHAPRPTLLTQDAAAPFTRSRPTLRGAYPALGLAALVVAAVIALYVPINGHDTASKAATSTPATSAHDGPARDAETNATTGSVSNPAGERRMGDARDDVNAAATRTDGGTDALPSSLPRYGGPTGTLQVRTQPAGVQVWVDGMRTGRSPVTLNVASGEHRVEVSSDGTSVKDMVVVQRDATTSVIIPLPAAPRSETAGAAPRAETAGVARAETAGAAGWVGITSPIDVDVFEGDQLIGTKETRRLMLPAGTHQLDIVNGDLGYASRRIVNVTPGKLTPLKVEVPPGMLAINALPWAEVWLDGQALGATPIGNVKTSVGTHEVVFRHPKLGEQRRAVVVPLSGIGRISVDMGAK